MNAIALDVNALKTVEHFRIPTFETQLGPHETLTGSLPVSYVELKRTQITDAAVRTFDILAQLMADQNTYLSVRIDVTQVAVCTEVSSCVVQ